MKLNPWIVANPLLMVVKFSDEQYSCKWREWAFLYVFACMYACMYVYDTPVSVLITDCRSLKKNVSEILVYFSFIICRWSDTSGLTICYADNEITAWKWANFTIYLSLFILLVLLANCINIPFLSFWGKWKT